MIEFLYMCPVCNSSAITTPMIATTNYTCEACGWQGVDVLALPLNRGKALTDYTFEQFAHAFLDTFAKSSALPIGQILVEWGFVPTENGKPSSLVLARFLKAMAGAALSKLIDERKTLEIERAKDVATGC